MRVNLIRLVASVAIAAVVDTTGARAEPTAPLPVVVSPGRSAATLGPQQSGPQQLALQQPGPRQLDPMLAPIALYPDPLIAQILAAATYPLEVVEADRWVQRPDHAALQGAQLAAALDTQAWDPSVKSLVPFAPVLRVMDDNLDWTKSLGEAFAASPDAVMDSVQRLRRLAQAAGQLQSTPQVVVTTQATADLGGALNGTIDGMPPEIDMEASDGTAGGIDPDMPQGMPRGITDGTALGTTLGPPQGPPLGMPQQTAAGTDDQPPILIEPATPDTVYVPVYDPALAYGPWPYPGYPPFGFPDDTDAFGGYGWFGVPVIAALWGWDRWDWRRHRIAIDRDRWTALAHRPWAGVDGTWQHGSLRAVSVARPFAPVGRLPVVVTPRVGFASVPQFGRGAVGAGRFEPGPAARMPTATLPPRGAGVRFAPVGHGGFVPTGHVGSTHH
jgi:hypothetical protein